MLIPPVVQVRKPRPSTAVSNQGSTSCTWPSRSAWALLGPGWGVAGRPQPAKRPWGLVPGGRSLTHSSGDVPPGPQPKVYLLQGTPRPSRYRGTRGPLLPPSPSGCSLRNASYWTEPSFCGPRPPPSSCSPPPPAGPAPPDGGGRKGAGEGPGRAGQPGSGRKLVVLVPDEVSCALSTGQAAS